MQLREFVVDDWSWVQEWFQDLLLDRELGPMDIDWLDAVLAERNGVQLVATVEGRPVVLIGCVWDTDHPPTAKWTAFVNRATHQRSRFSKEHLGAFRTEWCSSRNQAPVEGRLLSQSSR
jgi:hypothetical protein